MRKMFGRLEDATSAGDALRLLRIERGYSQEQLARRAGFHNSYLSQIERGRERVTPAVLDQLAPQLELTEIEYRSLYCCAVHEYLSASGWDAGFYERSIRGDYQIGENFGQTLRGWRRNEGLKGYEIAERLAITPEYLSRIENNRSAPSLRLVEQVAELIGADLVALYRLALSTKDREVPAGGIRKE